MINEAHAIAFLCYPKSPELIEKIFFKLNYKTRRGVLPGPEILEVHKLDEINLIKEINQNTHRREEHA